MSSKLMDYFNKYPRIGTLSTADKAGTVDSGVFGSPRMTDERTVVMGLGKNRTFANLQQNPHAVYLIMAPGATIMDWKGIRVYLKAQKITTSGPVLELQSSDGEGCRGRGGKDDLCHGELCNHRDPATHRYGPGVGEVGVTTLPHPLIIVK